MTMPRQWALAAVMAFGVCQVGGAQQAPAEPPPAVQAPARQDDAAQQPQPTFHASSVSTSRDRYGAGWGESVGPIISIRSEIISIRSIAILR